MELSKNVEKTLAEGEQSHKTHLPILLVAQKRIHEIYPSRAYCFLDGHFLEFRASVRFESQCKNLHRGLDIARFLELFGVFWNISNNFGLLSISF